MLTLSADLLPIKTVDPICEKQMMREACAAYTISAKSCLCDNSPKLNSHKRLENSDLHNLTKQEKPMMWNRPFAALM